MQHNGIVSVSFPRSTWHYCDSSFAICTARSDSDQSQHLPLHVEKTIIIGLYGSCSGNSLVSYRPINIYHISYQSLRATAKATHTFQFTKEQGSSQSGNALWKSALADTHQSLHRRINTNYVVEISCWIPSKVSFESQLRWGTKTIWLDTSITPVVFAKMMFWRYLNKRILFLACQVLSWSLEALIHPVYVHSLRSKSLTPVPWR